MLILFKKTLTNYLKNELMIVEISDLYFFNVAPTPFMPVSMFSGSTLTVIAAGSMPILSSMQAGPWEENNAIDFFFFFGKLFWYIFY